jgi:hypothetical protein
VHWQVLKLQQSNGKFFLKCIFENLWLVQIASLQWGHVAVRGTHMRYAEHYIAHHRGGNTRATSPLLYTFYQSFLDPAISSDSDSD